MWGRLQPAADFSPLKTSFTRLLHGLDALHDIPSCGLFIPRHSNVPPADKIPRLLPRRQAGVHTEERYSGLVQQGFRQANSNRIPDAGLNQNVEVVRLFV